MRKINIGICGLGTVAGGVVNVWQRNHKILAGRLGQAAEISHIGARRDHPECDTDAYRVSRDIFEVARDPNVHILLELIGGIEPARSLVLEAIDNGKHVVTANKALIAEHGEALLAAAQARGVELRFEAAVAGGIPVIKALTEGFSGNAIESIVGIINGTGNFILTEMREKNRSFAEALADAQRLGYAEADPTFDVEGIDAAQKLTILAALAYGTSLDASHCYTEGISNVSAEDIQHAGEMGYSIKHLGIARASSRGLEMRVHPALIPDDRLIANVHGVLNAVAIHGDAVGPTLLCGAGAGAEPTASAVIADVIDLTHSINCTIEGDKKSTQRGERPGHAAAMRRIMSIEEIDCAYYLRVAAADEPGALSKITQVLSEANISVESLHQKDPLKGAHAHSGETVPVVLTTEVTRESNLRSAVEKIESLAVVRDAVVVLRIESVS
ncbi:MAG: homoserine dehydrogenase [Pseudomonadales bacterium]|nr:homoserine dehydrogenase [Pseudomonadales bacterium]